MAQAPDPTPGRDMGRGYELVGLGLTFGVAIAAFVGGGLLLDRWLHLTPLFTIVGTLVGFAASFAWVYVKLNEQAESERRDREAGKR
jgi:F0F1-type ATP synthase assembly protein I